MIRLSFYNPKPQGNFKCSHQVLLRKIYLVEQKKTGVNWVKNLLSFMNCLNFERREELGWKSPFEIYFERKANELLNEDQNRDSTIGTSKYTRLSVKNYQDQHKRAKKWRRETKKTDDRIARRMLDSHARQNTYMLYKCGWKVFVRVGRKKDQSIRN